MTNEIVPIVMPKWGLAMTEGILTSWSIEEGAEIGPDVEIAEIETTKITNVFEAPVSGLVRRLVASTGETLPVGALLAVVADQTVSDADIDTYVAEFQKNFVPEEESGEDSAEPELIEIGGRSISYIDVGADGGDVVLLIHGFGADVNGWMFNQPVLAQEHRVVALDLPGHGRSTKDVGTGDVAVFADTVTGFISEKGFEKVHLVGHSLGGGAALKAALQPSVASLTLIAPVGIGKEINTEFMEGFLSAKRRKALQPVLEQLVADPALIGRDMIEDVLKFKRLDGVDAALRRIISANFDSGCQSVDLRSTLSDLSIPVTVIWGAEDKIIPSAHSMGLPTRVEVQIIPNAGHIPQMEESGAVNDLITATIGKA
ncbi:MAG: acetoin dehydrogenase dihydrolipoyllysine-residue acetyltransferase subunit [Hyphomicrobiales bacterium]|nr:acetoin dehydrogenase dihydrolipoyllysine-residue acetyltransferase subunit [Hyphomicrobiales bacterium]